MRLTQHQTELYGALEVFHPFYLLGLLVGTYSDER